MITSLPHARVIEYFKTLTDDPDIDCAELCRASSASIIRRVCENAEPERWEQLLCYAAACLAFYRYTLSRHADGISVYKAGDVTVTGSSGSSVASARALADDALAAVSGCLRPGGFTFRAVTA